MTQEKEVADRIMEALSNGHVVRAARKLVRDRIASALGEVVHTAREEGYRQGVGARVKPLVWTRFEVKHDYGRGVWDAQSAVGTYTILDCEREKLRYYCPKVSDQFSTLEAAKAAAQADYEQRIMSALEPGDVSERAAAGLSEAAIEGGNIVIRVPISTLPIAFKHWPDAPRDNEGSPLYRVADAAEFAKSVVGRLNEEGEDGTTHIHRMMDGAMFEAFERGDEGLEEVPRTPSPEPELTGEG